MDLYSFLFYFGAANGIILVFALLFRKENHSANLFLSGMLVAGIYAQWNRLLDLTGEISKFPFLIRSGFPFRLLFSALFYLYSLALTVPGFRWQRKYLLHFLPFFFGVVWYLGRLISAENFPGEMGGTIFYLEWYFITFVTIIVYGGYLIASFLNLQRFRDHVVDYFSEIRRIRLLWLQILLSALTVPWFLILLDALSGSLFTAEKFLIPTGTFIVILIGFFGLRQSVIFAPEEEWSSTYNEKIRPSSERPIVDLQPGFYSIEELAHWKKKLEEYSRAQKPYLDPQLRLIDLAKGLKLKPYQVSEILNRGMGTTFYAFINLHRVEEAKKRIKAPKFSHLNLLGIANESGFNSKSVFNDTFRKFTGMTPSAYRKTCASKAD